MLGRPDEHLNTSNGSDMSASRQFKRIGEAVDLMDHNAGFEDPCEVVQILKAQIESRMILTRKHQLATLEHLAG